MCFASYHNGTSNLTSTDKRWLGMGVNDARWEGQGRAGGRGAGSWGQRHTSGKGVRSDGAGEAWEQKVVVLGPTGVWQQGSRVRWYRGDGEVGDRGAGGHLHMGGKGVIGNVGEAGELGETALHGAIREQKVVVQGRQGRLGKKQHTR